jgi:hypothetical protein
MRALRRTLVLMGLLCVLAIVGMALPVPTMAKLADRLGLGRTLIETPLFIYTVRVMCATFVAIGVFLFILAGDPLRYGVMVPFAGAASVWIGVSCALFGMASRMGAIYFVGDAAACILLGIFVMRFHRRAVAEAEEANDDK